MAVVAAAVVGSQLFVAWKHGEEERIAERIRNEERQRAQEQLDERARAEADAGVGQSADSGTVTAIPAVVPDAGPAVAVVEHATTGGTVATSAAAGTTTSSGAVAVATSGGTKPEDTHVETPDKHHKDHHPAVDPTPTDTEPAAHPSEAGCASGMQLIPAGSFRLGTPASDDLGNFGDRPERKASSHGYCIDTYEYPNQQGARPLTSVTFSAAEGACKRDGKRLCSEEEWEKACKGPANHRFPYGEAFDASACRIKGGIASAGSAAGCRSGFGVFDLSGNVAEWTSSKFQAGASDRAVKGGAVESPDYDLRCSARANRSPSSRSERLGFRCCADVK
jgi:formylglycine-generating enzyme required for sulfatase activity